MRPCRQFQFLFTRLEQARRGPSSESTKSAIVAVLVPAGRGGAGDDGWSETDRHCERGCCRAGAIGRADCNNEDATRGWSS